MSRGTRRLPSGAWRENELSDEAIVGKVLEGDLALFEILIRRHQTRVYRTVRAILKAESEVEDVMQQAYLSAYTHLGEFAGNATFSTWLLRIAINRALTRLRALGRASGFDENPEAEPVAPEHEDPERQVEVQEVLAHLEAAVDDLPDIYRVVLVMREIDGLSTAETAESLSISEQTVKVRLHRARTQLRGDLAERIQARQQDLFQFAAPRCDGMVEAVFEQLATA